MEQFNKIIQSKYFKVFIALLIATLVFIVYKAISKAINSSDTYSRESRQNYSNSNLTYSNLEYENMANRLYDAMDRLNTDEETVKVVLMKLKNSDDWYKLANTFGVRECKSHYLAFDGGNLSQWLVYVHDSREQTEISEILSQINVNF